MVDVSTPVKFDGGLKSDLLLGVVGGYGSVVITLKLVQVVDVAVSERNEED